MGSLDMEKEGFEILGRSEEMAVVGISEIVAQYSKLKKVFDLLVAEAERRRPKVVVVMDYPEFNLMLSKKLHGLGIKVVYYISPQVWAWRKGRVKTIKKYCDKALLLFPFEVSFYESHSVPSEFVGHPLLDELDNKYFDPEYRRLQRSRYGITDNDVVLGLMPGSRRGELKNLLPQQLRVAARIAKKYQNVKILILCAPTIDKDFILSYTDDFKTSFQLVKADPYEMINLTDVVLAASGTATLMVGLLEKPMIIMYRMSLLTTILARTFIKGYFGLVNLILDEMAVPERLQWELKDDELESILSEWITNPVARNAVVAKLKTIISKLGNRGATERVSQILLEYVK